MKALLTYTFLLFTIALAAKTEPVGIRNFLFLNKNFQGGKIVPFETRQNYSAEGRITAFSKYVKENKAEEQLKALLNFKAEMELNDWLYFKLIRRLSESISASDAEHSTLYCWYLLSRSGYDCKIVSQDQALYIFVQSRDSVYEESYFNIGNKIYVRLPVKKVPDPYTAYTYYNFGFLEARRPFSLNDPKMPRYEPVRVSEKQISFKHQGKAYSYHFQIDPELRYYYNDKPNSGLRYTFSAGLSPVAAKSLIPQLQADLKSMDTLSGVQLLLSLTRNSFEYLNDLDKGREYYMTPEETLLAPESDCEDRSALFYYLVREIYQLPMLVLLYPGHVNIAVAFGKNAYGEAINFKGKKFSICEPTGPGNSLKVGEAPDFTVNQPYHILFYYPGR